MRAILSVHSRENAALRRCSLGLLAVAWLAGCATTEPEPTAPPRTEPSAPMTQVYVYPSGGQTVAQLDRDRYECHGWAVKQSGFDPNEQRAAPHQQIQVIAMPPRGADVAAGAATGAVLGAVVSRPRDAGAGAILGAMAGAVVGAAADSAQQQQASTIRYRYEERDAQLAAHLEQQASGYRRAIGACLEGRGYTVK